MSAAGSGGASWLRRLPLSLALLLGPTGAHAADARADKIPPSWVAYATHVSQALQARLLDDQDEAATRLHVFLDARTGADPAQDPPAPIVRLWFGKGGAISRVEFATLGDAQADSDLRHVVTAGTFGAPPRHMRQPLILRLKLTYPT
jgi:hypothetical protein